MPSHVPQAVESALAPLREGKAAIKLVLAVSGGVDSTVLLHSAASIVPSGSLVVASFDHGTGAAAREAVEFVGECARALGIEFVAGRAPQASGATPATESSWRDMRWAFLRRVAADVQSASGQATVICTAHTADDQVETVLMRAMRGAGARGLAGLAADSADVRRPLLAVTRRHVEAYAKEHGLEWIEDPSNSDPRHLRNRVRRQLLPALRRAAPEIDAELLSIGASAAIWRRDFDAWLDAHVEWRTRSGGIDVAVADLAALATEDLPVLWGAVAARGGAQLDWRGAARLADFTARGRVGGRVQLSGGWTVTRSRYWLELRAARGRRADHGETNQSHASVVLDSVALAADAAASWEPGVGCWRFTPGGATGRPVDDADVWAARLAPEALLRVRGWAPGDTVQVRASGPPRKVKALLTRAGITGELRRFWPVVLEGDRIVWVPGVCRSAECRALAATERSGRPGLPFVCAYVDR